MQLQLIRRPNVHHRMKTFKQMSEELEIALRRIEDKEPNPPIRQVPQEVRPQWKRIND